jgi:hypothetical protein
VVVQEAPVTPLAPPVVVVVRGVRPPWVKWEVPEVARHSLAVVAEEVREEQVHRQEVSEYRPQVGQEAMAPQVPVVVEVAPIRMAPWEQREPQAPVVVAVVDQGTLVVVREAQAPPQPMVVEVAVAQETTITLRPRPPLVAMVVPTVVVEAVVSSRDSVRMGQL